MDWEYITEYRMPSASKTISIKSRSTQIFLSGMKFTFLEYLLRDTFWSETCSTMSRSTQIYFSGKKSALIEHKKMLPYE